MLARTRSLLTSGLLLLALATGGCAAGTVLEDGDGHEQDHDALLVLEGPTLERELVSAPVRQAPRPFVRLALVYDVKVRAGAAVVPVEVSTSADGERWSAWTPVTVERLEDAETGTHVAYHDLGDAEARFYRVRAVDGAEPVSFLSVESLDRARIAAELDADAEDQAQLDEALGEGVSQTSYALTLRRYRFDQGRVTHQWLWLLRNARRRGWRGHLAGTRTGLRTYAEQEQLWNAYQAGWGAPAFPPWGPSRHLMRNVKRRGAWTMAIDTQDVPRLIRIARRLGVQLHVPYAHEPWHVEAVRRFRAPSHWRP